MHLLLFDIDGTLLNVEPETGLSVFTEVFRKVTELPSNYRVPEDYRFHGKTDRLIFQQLCERAGIDQETALGCLPAYEEEIVITWERELNPDKVNVLPGVRELLEHLAESPKYLLGLLTGNVEKAAHAKLTPHGLNQFFRVGAFGSDGTHRKELPPVAIERANQLNGSTFSCDTTVIIGDSNGDIECAAACNIRCIAVATGGLDAESLKAYNPDLLINSFEDQQTFLEFIAY